MGEKTLCCNVPRKHIIYDPKSFDSNGIISCCVLSFNFVCLCGIIKLCASTNKCCICSMQSLLTWAYAGLFGHFIFFSNSKEVTSIPRDVVKSPCTVRNFIIYFWSENFAAGSRVAFFERLYRESRRRAQDFGNCFGSCTSLCVYYIQIFK